MRSNVTARLRTVFFGTSAFALPALDALAGAHDVVAVVTQPDRPAGRGLEVRSPPVLERTRALDLPSLTPPGLDAAFVDRIARLRPQVLACISYGRILPKALLSIDGSTPLNVHPSLLPEYRGASPIQAALRDGRERTGVTVFWMAAEMDAGDIALQREINVTPADDYGSLHGRLASVGAALLLDAMDLLAAGRLLRAPQDHARATYTRPIRKEDLRIPEGVSSRAIVNLVRSASPAPAAWTIVNGLRMKILEARAEPPDAAGNLEGGPLIESADGFVRLLRVVPEGKREMTGAQAARFLAQRK